MEEIDLMQLNKQKKTESKGKKRGRKEIEKSNSFAQKSE